MKLPNFFIVGTGKAGTTSLYSYLDSHPQVFMCPIKEPNYFATDIDPAGFDADYQRLLVNDYGEFQSAEVRKRGHIAHITKWSDYEKLFSAATDEPAVGEISNAYLFSRTSAQEIAKRIPEAKIVMVLRDPVERAFSQYLMELRLGLVGGTFIEEVENDLAQTERKWGSARLYVDAGRYSEQVKRFLDAFPSDQIAIYLFEELSADTHGLLRRLYEFLQIDPDQVPHDLSVRNRAMIARAGWLSRWAVKTGVKAAIGSMLPEGAKRIFRKAYYTDRGLPRLSAADRQRCLSHFVSDIVNLQTLIDTDLSNWTK